MRGYLRNERAGFKMMGFVKARLVHTLLRLGYDVLLSDADSVFLGNPWPWIGPILSASSTTTSTSSSSTSALALDAGLLPTADVLLSNDYPDLRRDGQPDSVFNSGLAFLRCTPRAIHFVAEWAERTRRTAEIGNDQSEINRLLRGRYRDGDYRCNHDGCLEPDPMLFMPAAAVFRGADCPTPPTQLLSQLRRALLNGLNISSSGGGGSGGGGSGGGGSRSRSSSGSSSSSSSSLEGQDDDDHSPCPAPCAWLAPSTADDHRLNLRTVPLVAATAAWRRCREHQEKRGRRLVGQSRQVYCMWGGRVRFGLLPMERFLQGHTYFIQRLHEARGVSAVHVHLTYVMGADFGKEWRLRSDGLWREEPREDIGGATSQTAQAPGSSSSSSSSSSLSPSLPPRFVRVTGVEALFTSLIDRMKLPAEVWRCEPPDGHAAGGERKIYGYHTSPDRDESQLVDRPSIFFNGQRDVCFHPKHLIPEKSLLAKVNLTKTTDPAAPHVALQRLLRELLRNAFALAYATSRKLVLPRLWALCERHWWQLLDCRTPGVESLPLPYEAPLDVAFDAERWERVRGVGFVEHRYQGLDGDNVSTTRLELQTGGSLKEPSGEKAASGRHQRVHLQLGVTFDGAAGVLLKAYSPPAEQSDVVEVDASHLLRFSGCGFDDSRMTERFQRDVLEHIFAGQYSYCSEERNPFVDDLLKEAAVTKVPAEQLLVNRRNCTGQPSNAFNKPKVDLGPSALAFRPLHSCGQQHDTSSIIDGAEDAVLRALALVQVRAGWMVAEDGV